VSIKVLIVEDHADSLEILAIQLQALGYEVIEAREPICSFTDPLSKKSC